MSVQVIIATDGRITIKSKGLAGAECDEVSAFLEKSLAPGGAMAAILDPYRHELEKREVDLGAVAAALASTAIDALHWYAFMELRRAKKILKERDAAIRRFRRVARGVLRLRPIETPLDGKIDAALDRVESLLRIRIPPDKVTVRKAWSGFVEFTTTTRPPDAALPAHRAPKPWRRAADRALFDLCVTQDIRRGLLTAIDRQARQ